MYTLSNETLAHIREKAHRVPGTARVSLLFLLSGLVAIAVYAVVSFDIMLSVNEYFSHAKITRDAAESGSAILAILSLVESSRAWLEPLKLLGISLIIFGIAISFATSILEMLKLRLAVTGELVAAILHK